MQNFIQEGRYLTLPAAPYALDPGDGALVGSIFGVSANASESGAECVLAVEGVFTLPKVFTDAVTVGAALYWDNTDKVVTVVSTAHTRIGVAVAASPASTTTNVDVRLHGAW